MVCLTAANRKYCELPCQTAVESQGRTSSDAFGKVTGDSSPAIEGLFLYTARPYDEDGELQNNLNRWYDLSTGRWMSTDPIGFEAGDVNLYRYVGNSPTNVFDPTGFSTIGVRGLQSANALIEEQVRSGQFVAFQTAYFNQHEGERAHGTPENSDAIEEVSSLDEVCCAIASRPLPVTVVEITGHAVAPSGNSVGHYNYDQYHVAGSALVDVSNAQSWGRAIGASIRASGTSRGQGLIIWSFCLAGTYTKQDRPGYPRSVVQLLANAAEMPVLSPGGFMMGSFAGIYGIPQHSACSPAVDGKFGGKTNWGRWQWLKDLDIAHESKDDFYYLTFPEPPRVPTLEELARESRCEVRCPTQGACRGRMRGHSER